MALLGEFELIARYFTQPVRRAALGVGDDCALLAVAPGMSLAVSSDMLVEAASSRRSRPAPGTGAGGEPGDGRVRRPALAFAVAGPARGRRGVPRSFARGLLARRAARPQLVGGDPRGS
jgi:hypothetical protein